MTLLQTKRVVKYGIIGCGRVASKHSSAIIADKYSELVGVFDVIPERSHLFSKLYDCFNFQKQSELIKSVDVVCVCTPHYTHGSIIKKILQSGKICICEKPANVNNRDALIINRLNKKEDKLFIVLQNRFNPAIQYLRLLTKSKILGSPRYIFANVRWFRDASYYINSWQGNKKKEGGLLFNQGIHVIDALIYSVINSYKSIRIINTVRDRIFHKNITTEDIFLAHLLLGKVICNFEITTASTPQNIESGIYGIYDKGSIHIGGLGLNKLIFCKALPGIKLPKMPPTINQFVDHVYGNGHAEFIKSVSLFVQTGRKDSILASFKEVCQINKLITMLYRNAGK